MYLFYEFEKIIHMVPICGLHTILHTDSIHTNVSTVSKSMWPTNVSVMVLILVIMAYHIAGKFDGENVW